MRWNLQICLATTVLLSTYAAAKSPVEQPSTARPMTIVALDLKFDDEPIEFADDISYSRSREILTRHHRWTKNILSFSARHTRLPSTTELTIVDPAQFQIQAQPSTDGVLVISQHGAGQVDGACSCTRSH